MLKVVQKPTTKRTNSGIGLSSEQVDGVVAHLNRVLADEIVLYAKTRDYHWNVVGPQFHDLHVFLESQYEELDGIGDSVAERTRSLGGPALGTIEDALRRARLKEQPGHDLSAADMIGNLLADHEAVIRHLRKDLEIVGDEFEDEGTKNFLTDLMEQHEKMAWMLRASVEDRS